MYSEVPFILHAVSPSGSVLRNCSSVSEPGVDVGAVPKGCGGFGS